MEKETEAQSEGGQLTSRGPEALPQGSPPPAPGVGKSEGDTRHSVAHIRGPPLLQTEQGHGGGFEKREQDE